ncbi:methenyltetrahydrofolate synthase domain-containing protein-like [Ylistrum balloti]|uniref:methenyltetrahydrofolate synthase domain-containing protein-like n=1 Tax=Ylistrum balloti TaxID=509963 RepID=UPI002905C239|nr:methenyltetrahydrofolate synthase domain-containing protein-like [Ylistrum balloti]
MSESRTPAESVKAMGPEEITKQSIRKVVWDYLEQNNLVNFPRPVYNRIPNFKGAANAAEKVPTMAEFKSARVVKVNPDKPQENVRFLTLEANKTLLVPTPRLRTGLFNRIVVPEDANKEMLRICSTTQGVREHSEPIGLDDKVKVDLIVIGSVAVSKEGFRIGKGEGFGDLEYAMMKSMGAIDDNTIVISTVHDCQVLDIPESLMTPHDVQVNYIVTPTEIIKCDCKRSQPKGIIWSYITPKKMRQVAILRRLRVLEREAGVDVTLKDGEEFDETADDGEDEKSGENDRYRRRRPPFNRRRRAPGGRGRRRPNSERDGEIVNEERGESSGNEATHAEGDQGRPQRRRRPRPPRRRRRASDRRDEGEENSEQNVDEYSPREGDGDREMPDKRRGKGGERRAPRRMRNNPRTRMPTIFVGSIPRATRVSELKTRIREMDIFPIRVIWHGARGYAFFQFTKQGEMETALDSLREFEINGKQLRIEESKPMTNRSNNSSGDRGDGDVDINGAADGMQQMSIKNDD